MNLRGAGGRGPHGCRSAALAAMTPLLVGVWIRVLPSFLSHGERVIGTERRVRLAVLKTLVIVACHGRA